MTNAIIYAKKLKPYIKNGAARRWFNGPVDTITKPGDGGITVTIEGHPYLVEREK